MAGSLDAALAEVRTRILDGDALVRALATGRRKGARPPWRRVELRYVDLKAGRRLQVVKYDETQAHTSNHEDAAAVLDELFAEPFGNWHVETTTETLQLRVTKSGDALLAIKAGGVEPAERSHDRAKPRLLAEDDPVLMALGISDEQGRVKPSRRAKYRQVEEFVRELAATVDDALAAGSIRPTAERPLRVVDLGCGNAYLTFAAHAWLSRVRGLPTRVTGVDVKEQSRRHNTEVAERLGVSEDVTFVVGGIADVELDERPDVVLALHACDTATDDALARAVAWEAPLVLAAPCCHKDVSRQLRDGAGDAFTALLRDGILRERFADTLTDALRAGLLRTRGYRVDVVEFVGSEHTPRNTLLRAVATGADGARARDEVAELTGTWQVRPYLATLLEP